ncbi:MAG: toxin-antitoxin system YwqK family antitoxin [Candidatus Limnocylindrales bacterium]
MSATPDSDRVPETILYTNGGIKHRGTRLEGETHGPWEFYRLDGSLMRAGSFDRGRQIGTWRTFDSSGEVVKETEFQP